MNSDFLELLKQSNGNEESFKKMIIQHKNIINNDFIIKIDNQEITYSPLTYCLDIITLSPLVSFASNLPLKAGVTKTILL